MSGIASGLLGWLDVSLRRKLAGVLLAALAAASLVFLVFLVTLYRERLVSERQTAAAQVTQLLQATLENAMLKRTSTACAMSSHGWRRRATSSG
ncbi:MAG: hypothetical protein R3D25_19320 [Geminicoccaceae bacterium]